MGLNLQNLSDEELDLIEQKLITQQSPQNSFNLENLSDEQLDQLERRLKPKEPGVLSKIGQKFAQLPEQLQNLSAQDFLNEFLSPEQTEAEKAQAGVVQDVIAPILGLPGEVQSLIQQVPLVPEAPVQLPTTEEIKEFVDNLLGTERIDLKEETEFVNDVVKDVALLSLPLGESINFLRAIGTGLFANVGAQGLVDTGVISEGSKDLAKMGLMFMSSFSKPFTIRKKGTELLEKAEETIKGRVITDGRAPGQMKEIARNLRRAGGEATHPKAIKFAEGLIKDLETGTFEGNLVTKATRNLNKLRGKEGLASAEGIALTEVRKGLQDIAERMGNGNPQFIKFWNEGNQLFQAANTRNFISEWVRNKIPSQLVKKLPLELAASLGLGLVTGKVAAASVPAIAIANAMTRFKRFPAVRNLYFKFLNEAASNNVKAATTTLEQLRKAFEKTQNQEDQ